MQTKTLGVTLFILVCASFAGAQSNQSVYTSLSTKSCRTIRSTSTEGGSYVGICPGVAGYKLQSEEGDLRQNIQVITPNGKKHSLELWNVVGSGFSALGEKAEWRVKRQNGKTVPVALILRYNVANPENSSKGTSYLAIAKITSTKICITEKIAPKADANVAARIAADNAGMKSCIESSQ
ncbi:MAG TPA: hypothetical protein VK557_08880 [Pyrinomonadaceae bacterium]|nr:hypothetical protein [Pyrinomonadaceae bacterium]